MASATFAHRRDPRLDFFRGIAMFIIYVAHLPDNIWALWIPARFGFSDAAEIFVFCSGMASAVAFGKVFQTCGWGLGTARVVHRIWQVYWAHIALFIVIASGLAAIQESGYLQQCCGLTRNYVTALNLQHFFDAPQTLLPALLTLSYVPNYFDILPMYIAILAMLPVVMALARVNVGLVFIFMVVSWLAATLGWVHFPAEPWSDRPWFFNPFAWQLVFFTGFAFMRGWIPAPPVKGWLIVLALAIVFMTVPFAYSGVYKTSESLLAIRRELEPFWNKTNFGVLRYVHFLALAYVAWVCVGENGDYLRGGGLWGGFVSVVQKVGQQSLAVFLSSLVIAQSVAIVRDMASGRGSFFGEALANIGGFAALIAVAYGVGWFKSQPWRKPASSPPSSNGPSPRA